jgi:hypothetical protein
VRATKRPPAHLVGRRLGTLRVAVYAARKGIAQSRAALEAGTADWIAPDDALPEHPSVVWRRATIPRSSRATASTASSRCSSWSRSASASASCRSSRRRATRRRRPERAARSAESELWLLAHPESRHLRRVAAVYGHLARSLALP